MVTYWASAYTGLTEIIRFETFKTKTFRHCTKDLGVVYNFSGMNNTVPSGKVNDTITRLDSYLILPTKNIII